jgi:glycosyltransferase involved in cell wall biosynthesis
MPTYRRAEHIGGAIRSLLTGEWSDFELVVQDDGDGSDGTREAVDAASEGDPRVRYVRNQRNLGLPGNLNAAVASSTGKLIAMCHDHDLYRPSFLRRMVETIRRHPSALFVHCAIREITQTGEVTRTHVGGWPELTNGHDWLRYMLSRLDCPVCALTVVRREAHEEFGMYDPAFGFVADIDLWMRLSCQGDVAYVGEPIIDVREREAGHPYQEVTNTIAVYKKVAAIHRKYIPLAFGGAERAARRIQLEWQIRRSILRIRAGSLARRAFRPSPAARH